MNWDAIGAIGEVFGAAAVVVSLVYLAAQIRTQNREARLAAMHEISAAFRDSIATFTDVERAEIITRGNEDFDSLSDPEVFVLLAGIQRLLRVWEEAYHQHKEGRLDSYIWNVMCNQYGAFITAASFQRVWELRREYFDPEFRNFVEQMERSEYKLR